MITNTNQCGIRMNGRFNNTHINNQPMFSSSLGGMTGNQRSSNLVSSDLLKNLQSLIQVLLQQLGNRSEANSNGYDNSQDARNRHSNSRSDNGQNKSTWSGISDQQPPSRSHKNSDRNTNEVNQPVENPSVTLSDEQRQAIETLTGLTDVRVDDQDKSGTLSAGDVVVSSVPDSQKYSLTAQDIGTLLGATDSGIPNSLSNINESQANNILSRFSDLITQDIIDKAATEGLAHPFVISDDDHSADISVGDRLLVGNNVDGNLTERTLTADDVRFINASALSVDAAKKNDLAGALGVIPNYVSDVLDLDGDSQISVGDVAVLSGLSGQNGHRTLTADDLVALNNTLNLTPEQHEAIATVLNRNNLPDENSTITASTSYLHHAEDRDGNGGISAGDAALLWDSTTQSAVKHILTEADVANIDTPPSRLSLGQAKIADILNTLGLQGSLNSVVLDFDGNDELSTGDVFMVNDASSQQYELSQNLLDDLNNGVFQGTTLTLSDQQRTDLEQQLYEVSDNSFGSYTDRFTTTFTGTVVDENGDGLISIGDTAKIKRVQEFQNLNSNGLQVNETLLDHKITLEDFLALSTEQGRLQDVLTDLNSFEFSGNNAVGSVGYSAVDARLRAALPSSVLNDAGQISFILSNGDVPYISNVLDQNQDNKLSPGDTIVIDKNSGSTVEHVLTQQEYDRFINGEKYIDPALATNTNPNLDDTQKNVISSFLDEARRYGEIRVSIQLLKPDDYPAVPAADATQAERDAYGQQIEVAVKQLTDDFIAYLGQKNLDIPSEEIQTYSSIPYALLSVTAEQLLEIANYQGVEGVLETRQGATNA